MSHAARATHHRVVRGAKKKAEVKEGYVEDQASVDAVNIAKRNVAAAARRSRTALALKTSLHAQLAAAESATIQAANTATFADEALDIEWHNASRIAAARQHLSNQDPSCPPSQSASVLWEHHTSPRRSPSRSTPLAASSPPERLVPPSHSSDLPTLAYSRSTPQEDQASRTIAPQQLAPFRPADIKEKLPNYDPGEGTGTTNSTEVSGPSMPEQYVRGFSSAVWAGMTATARATHVQMVRAAREFAKLEQESLEDQASANAVATAKANAAIAARRSRMALSLKANLHAQLAAAESAVFQTADKATFAGRTLDSEKCRASRILSERRRLSSQDPSLPPSWHSSPQRLHDTKQPPKRPRSTSNRTSRVDPAAALFPRHQKTKPTPRPAGSPQT